MQNRIFIQTQTKTNKQKTKKKQPKKQKPIYPSVFSAFSSLLVARGAAVYHAVDPFIHAPLLANVHCVMSCWSGLRLLASGTSSASYPHQTSSQISYRCPSHGDPVAMVPLDHTS